MLKLFYSVMVKHGTTVKASVNDNNNITLITTDKMHLNLRAQFPTTIIAAYADIGLVTQSFSPRGRGRDWVTSSKKAGLFFRFFPLALRKYKRIQFTKLEARGKRHLVSP